MFFRKKDRLSQWRAYGQDGTGVAIGFNYKAINLLNNEKDIFVEKVVYNEIKQKEKLGQLIESVIIYIKNMFEEESVRISDDFNVYFKEEFDTFCEVLVDHIGKIRCTIKNPAFAEEKEISDYRIKPLKFNLKNNQFVSYCDIDFNNLIHNPIINEIVIGSKSQLKESDIYYFLLSNGFDANNVNISKSEATYR